MVEEEGCASSGKGEETKRDDQSATPAASSELLTKQKLRFSGPQC